MGPTMYVWVRFAAKLWPKTDFKTSVRKAVTEQFTVRSFFTMSYQFNSIRFDSNLFIQVPISLQVDPTLICTFLFVMSLLEQKTVAEAKEEVSALCFIMCMSIYAA